MDGALLVARLILAAVFLVAGVGKLVDQPGSRKAMREFGLPEPLPGVAGMLLPVVELAIAVALVPTRTAVYACIAAGLLLLLFVVAIAVNLAMGRRPDCHCFGQVASGPIGWSTLVRNAVLVVIAGFVVIEGRAGTNVLLSFTRLSTTDAILLTATAVVLTLVIGQWGFLVSLLQQNGRLLSRLEQAEKTLDMLAKGTPAAEAMQQATQTAPPQVGLEVGTQAPDFSLTGIFGETMTLSALRARGKPVMLLFTDPYCGPCNGLMPDIGRWQRDLQGQVTIAVLSRGKADENRAKATEHGVSQVLLQKDFEVANQYQAHGTPSAVMVEPDNTIGSYVFAGADAIRQLVAHAFESPAPAAAPGAPPIPLLDQAPQRAPAAGNGNGHAHGHVEAPRPRGLGVGALVPSLELTTLDGDVVDLQQVLEERGRRTLLVFWNLTCGFCQRMLPDLQQWERSRSESDPDLIVISSGPAAENRSLDFKTVLLDQQHRASEIFDAPGTPMGVLIDEHGVVASEVGAGAPGVFALVGGGEMVVANNRGQNGAQGGGGAASAPAGAAARGTAVPDIQLKDLEGRPVSLRDVTRQTSLLLFWNHGCGFCQQMLSDLREWEYSKPKSAPNLVVIANGTPEQGRSLNLKGTVLLDSDFRTGPAFGANGTPMAVLVGDGQVLSDVAAGAPGVFALAAGSPDGAQSGRR